MSVHKCLFFVLCCFATGAISSAVGVPHLSIPDLVSSSEVIAIVDVGAPKLIGPGSPITFRAQLVATDTYVIEMVTRKIIKGFVPDHFAMTYLHPKTFIGYRGINVGNPRVVFLRRAGSGYVFADPYHPSLPATNLLVGAVDSDPVKAVIVQLANVLVSPTVSRSERNEVQEIDYALPNDEYFLAILRSGLHNLSDPEARQIVQRQLVLHGDISELPAVTKLLLNAAEIPDQRIGLLYVIGNHVTDARALPMIKPLLDSNDSQVRTAAAEALWHIGSQTALEPAAKALNDSDGQVRYYAIRALADITHQPQWGPSIPEYEENGKKYLDYWLDWAKSAATVRQK